MYRHIPAGLIFAVMAFAATTASAQSREWSDSTGRFKIEAELVEVTAEGAKLRRADGNVTTVPINRLSEADQKYIQQLGNKQPPASVTAGNANPLDSIVRISFNPQIQGRRVSFEIIGVAVQTTEATPVIVANRFLVQIGIDPADLDAAVAKARILPMSGAQPLGTVTGVGFPSPQQFKIQDLVDGTCVIVLRTAAGTRIPALPLSLTWPEPKQAVQVPILSEAARGRVPGPVQRITWHATTVAEKSRFTALTFFLEPMPQQSQVTAALPVLNQHKHLIGLTGLPHPNPSEPYVLSNDGIFAGIDKSKISINVPVDDIVASYNFPSIRSAPIDVNVPWRKSYEQLLSTIKPEKEADGSWKIDWGQAADLGVWYERAKEIGPLEHAQQFNKEGTTQRAAIDHRINAIREDLARAAARLEGIEWTGALNFAYRAGTHVELQQAKPPEPIQFWFMADKNDTVAAKKGDRIRFACRFDAGFLNGVPSITVYTTVKEVLPP